MAKLLTEEVGQLLAGKIKDNKTAIQANSTAIATNASDITTINAAIATLNGSGEGSVDKKVADAIADVVAEAPQDLDTLKEIADFISNDHTSAAEMSNKIAANQSSITTINAAIAALESDKVDKDGSKTLTTNDYDDTEKNTVATLKSDMTAAQSSITTMQAAISALETAELDLVTTDEAEGWFSTSTPDPTP